MRIGIITVQRAPNYGAMLQCYALQQYLIKRGYECEVIDLLRPDHTEYISSAYKPYALEKKTFSVVAFINKLRKNIGFYLLGYAYKKRKFSKTYKRELQHKIEMFNSFNDEMLYSKKYCSIQELYDSPPVYDVYMTGSDQLWNPTQPYCVEPYFLTFVINGGKKVSYATSIGVSVIPEAIRDSYLSWLSDYDLISVREQNAVDLLSPKLSKEIVRLIDPTFLLKPSEWLNIADESLLVCKEKYLFYFTIGFYSDLHQYLKKYCKKNNLKLVYIVHGSSDSPCNNEIHEIGLIDVSPKQWLGLIRNAEKVVTDSFHGSVFSILFKKNFISYIDSSNTRGSRIENLLALFNLENQLFRTGEEPNWLEEDLNYDVVFEKIKKEKKRAELFINKINEL